jgi:hypothetical protein
MLDDGAHSCYGMVQSWTMWWMPEGVGRTELRSRVVIYATDFNASGEQASTCEHDLSLTHFDVAPSCQCSSTPPDAKDTIIVQLYCSIPRRV